VDGAPAAERANLTLTFVAFVNMEGLQPDGTETDKQGLIGVDHVAFPSSDFLMRRTHEPVSPIRGALSVV